MSAATSAIRTVAATRYVAPLREGGSLPALVEADDDGLYVLKFRGAGQGPKVLVAEWLAGEIARAAGLRVPEIVLVELDGDLGRAEPDAEIRALLAASVGINLGLDYLPGALAYDPTGQRPPDPDEAADIVWLDALVTNVDRTARNPNLLVWHGATWLIDHGAALYLQHGAQDLAALADRPFPAIREHVLLAAAGSIPAADERLRDRLDTDVFAHLVSALPGAWLDGDGQRDPGAARTAYVAYLTARLDRSAAIAREAEGFRDV